MISMALQQVVEREILAETGSLAKLENNDETCSNGISDESKAGKADGTSVKSASSTDKDENRERKRTQMSINPQLEKQYIFLKKHFDELRTRKRIPNFYKRYGVQYRGPIKKTMKFEDFPCLCHLEKKCLIYENTNQAIELLVGQEPPTTAQSHVSTKSQINPLAGHNILCNVQRLNRYFRLFTRYFIGKDAHENLFLLDPNPPVDYKQKAMREIRKMTVLKLRHGLEVALEEWEDCMTDKDVEKLEKRNNIREYLHFILNNMLESLIGPNESLTGSEDEDADDSDLSPSRRNTRIDPDKLEYQSLKKLHEELEVKLKNFRERRRKFIQEAVIEGYYNDLKNEIRERIYNYCNIPPAVSSEESEVETGQEKI